MIFPANDGENTKASLEERISQATSWLSRANDMFTDLLAVAELREPLDADALKLRKTLLATAKSIGATSSRSKKAGGDLANKAFSLLFHVIALQLLHEPAEAKEAGEDLLRSHELLTAKPKTPSKGKAAAAAATDEEPEPVAVVTDVLLSLLVKPSQLLRTATEQSFAVLCGQMTRSAMELLFQVLEPVTSEDGMVEEEIEEDDEDEEMDMRKRAADDDEEEEEEDEEDEEEEDDDDEDSDDDTIDEDDDDAPVDEELRRNVERALRAANAHVSDDDEMDVDDAAEDDEDDSDDDEPLGDDDMALFDAKLSEIFRLRKSEKAERADAKRNALHFKFKVLHLLEIFYRKNPTSPLVVLSLVPLVRASRAAGANKELHDKTTSLIRSLTRRKEVCLLTTPEQRDGAVEIISSLLIEARRDSTAKFSAVVSDAVAYAVRAAFSGAHHRELEEAQSRLPKKSVAARVVAQFEALIDPLMKKKRSRVQPILLESFLQRFPTLGVHLGPQLANYANLAATARPYQSIVALKLALKLAQAVRDAQAAAVFAPAAVDAVAATLERVAAEGLKAPSAPPQKKSKKRAKTDADSADSAADAADSDEEEEKDGGAMTYKRFKEALSLASQLLRRLRKLQQQQLDVARLRKAAKAVVESAGMKQYAPLVAATSQMLTI